MCVLLVTAMHTFKSTALRVGVKTLHNTTQSVTAKTILNTGTDCYKFQHKPLVQNTWKGFHGLFIGTFLNFQKKD